MNDLCPSSRIKWVRHELGWSQPTMGLFLGVTQAAVSLIERGQQESGPISRLLDQLEMALRVGRVARGQSPEAVLKALTGSNGDAA
jgi:DNA-binding XRE family transcriptional regulator